MIDVLSRFAGPSRAALTRVLVWALLLACGLAGPFVQGARAQTAGPPAVQGPSAPASPPAPVNASSAPALALAATFGDGAPIRSGLVWRVFTAQTDGSGPRKLVTQSESANPVLPIAPGDYYVHAAYGLAGAAAAVTVPAVGAASLRIPLRAGALRVSGRIGAAPIPPQRLAIDIYVPQPGNSEAKLVVRGARAGEAIGLPEGLYHIVSTYLDAVGVGATSLAPGRGLPTNSIVSTDLRVDTGRLTDATLRHRAAMLTLKLVNGPGGEALANTSFTVLTPGGDVIRELVGAFPSLVLAEGQYDVIARRDGRTYQSSLSVKSAEDRDIEILAK
jgi:hypothetical protein